MSVLVTGVGLALGGLREPRALREGDRPLGVVEPASVLGRRGLLYSDRATQLALCAAHDALRAASMLEGTKLTVSGELFGVVASSSFGNVDTVCEVAAKIAKGGIGAISPMDLPNASSNVVASSISIRFQLRGPNFMICNGATGGIDAAYIAASLIRSGRAERVVVVGVEPRNEIVAEILCVDMGELLDGAAALVLESAASATRRDATVLGAIGPYGADVRLEGCVDQARRAEDPLPAVWLVPESLDGTTPSVLAEVPQCDLSANLGRCAGALGVLQCVAGLAWISEAGANSVLATTGGIGDEPFAALVLNHHHGSAVRE